MTMTPDLRRSATVGGIGALAFAILTFVALFVSDGPGGSYSASQATRFVSHGHRATVIISAYVALMGIVGLICLLGHLRRLIGERDPGGLATTIFWGAGLAGATSFAIGWSVFAADVIARAEGGSGVVLTPVLIYLFAEVGATIIFGPGAVLLGVALLIVAFTAGALLPSWLRWLTVIAGIGGLAGPLFFPSFLLIVWGIAVGIWLLATREPAPVAVAQPAA
jgi:hypothetical protein